MLEWYEIRRKEDCRREYLLLVVSLVDQSVDPLAPDCLEKYDPRESKIKVTSFIRSSSCNLFMALISSSLLPFFKDMFIGSQDEKSPVPLEGAGAGG